MHTIQLLVLLLLLLRERKHPVSEGEAVEGTPGGTLPMLGPTAVAPSKGGRSLRSLPITAQAEAGLRAEGGPILVEDLIHAGPHLVKHTQAPTMFLPRCCLTTLAVQIMRRLMTLLLGLLLLPLLQAAQVVAAALLGMQSLSTAARNQSAPGTRGLGSSRLPGRSLRSLPVPGESHPSRISSLPHISSLLQTNIRRAMLATLRRLNHIRIRRRSSSRLSSLRSLHLLPIKVATNFAVVFAICRLLIKTHFIAISGGQRVLQGEVMR